MGPGTYGRRRSQSCMTFWVKTSSTLSPSYTLHLLPCTISGDPQPVVTWYHAGAVLPGEMADSLTLVGVAKDDEGMYECAGSNQAGNARATITLT